MTGRLTSEDLVVQGFTAEQIERLAALRAGYPLIEWVTREQLQRLRFLKWRHTHQLLPASEPGIPSEAPSHAPNTI